jgi:hypothetical protein
LASANGFLDSLQPLRQFHARTSPLDHRDRAAQMAFGAPEPLDDLRMGSVEEILDRYPIPLEWMSSYCVLLH